MLGRATRGSLAMFVEDAFLVEVEVCDFHVSLRIDENVLGFQVAEDTVQVVKVFDRQEDFGSVDLHQS